MSRRITMGALLAFGTGSLVGLGVAWQRRIHKLWVIPEAPSRRQVTEGLVPAAPLSRVRVLFVGHSLVNQDMPAMARAVAASVGVDFTYDVQLVDGGSLQVNWNEAERATGVRAREALAGGGYDTVVLTEAVNLDDHLRWSEPASYAARWYALAREHRADARLFFYETWHHRDQPRHARGLPFLPSRLSWRQHLDADLDKWEHIVDSAEREYALLHPAAPRLDVHIVPGGQALAALVDAIRAGQVPGVPSESALFADGVHLSPLGNYFIALVQVRTLSGAELDDATGSVPGADGRVMVVPPATSQALARIASGAVRFYPRSGVLIPPEPI
jgi:hypothetical protein